jgi:beta-glucosidase
MRAWSSTSQLGIVLIVTPVYLEGDTHADYPVEDEAITDTLQITSMREHLTVVSEAIAEAVDVRGSMHWSLFDNWEWAE